ncbi:MAG: hypothetical protein ACO1TE_00805 [Prosthecobacter sp.]
MKHRILVFPTLAALCLLALSACTTPLKLPPSTLESQDAPEVRWQAATATRAHPALLLMPRLGGEPLAQVESVFTPDAVEVFGPPAGDRLRVFVSPTGNTVLAHEDASESSPEEQLAVFRRGARTAPWQAQLAWPPHQKGPVYGRHAVSEGVDDTFLYYRFPGGKLQRVALAQLKAKGA